jgi:hypothetical protein
MPSSVCLFSSAILLATLADSALWTALLGHDEPYFEEIEKVLPSLG